MCGSFKLAKPVMFVGNPYLFFITFLVLKALKTSSNVLYSAITDMIMYRTPNTFLVTRKKSQILATQLFSKSSQYQTNSANEVNNHLAGNVHISSFMFSEKIDKRYTIYRIG